MSDLSRYRWHTGAPLRRVDVDEGLPPLVRDVGPVALARFLRGTLRRLAGPQTPLLYLRTPQWREPYVDHAGTGRLLFLRPHDLDVWFSGVSGVYVARADARPRDGTTLVYLPAGVAVPDDASDARDAVAEAVAGGRVDDDLRELDALNDACARVEALARSLRRFYQSGNETLRRLMELCAVDERDLCAAYHHLEAARRATLEERLRALAARFGSAP